MAPTYLRLTGAAACLATSLTCLAMPDRAAATVRRVPTQYPGINPAVTAAVSGDTILVAPGTYTGMDNKRISFYGKDLVLLSEAGANVTIIDIEGYQEPEQGFSIHHGETSATVIDGFTIQGGYLERGAGAGMAIGYSSPTVRNCVFLGNRLGSPYYDVAGGAVAIGTDGSPTFTNCSFLENGVWYFGEMVGGAIGGAVVVSNGGSAVFADCSFSGNFAWASALGHFFGGEGGAVATIGSSCELRNCVFTDNDAKGQGGAVVGGTGLSVVDCVFDRNSADWYGGAMAVWGAVATGSEFRGNSAHNNGAIEASNGARFMDCLFVDNRADQDFGAAGIGGGDFTLERCRFIGNSGKVAGAVMVEGRSLVVTQCTLYRNAATQGPAGIRLQQANNTGAVATVRGTIIASSSQGPAIECDALSRTTLTCSDVFGNAGGDYVGCISGLQGVEGNISADPLFCDGPGGDLSLHADSPCAPANAPQGCGLIGALDVGCGVTAIQEVSAPSGVRLRVLPNPVRHTAAFRVEPEVGAWTLDIYDAQGRLLECLHPRGTELLWPLPKSAQSGVYFGRVGGGAPPQVVKFLILR